MPDQKLEAAIKEVKQICLKYDIAAFVVLASETHLEYLAKLDPSWSCVIPIDGGIRIRAIEKEFPDKETQIECITNTVGLFAGLHSLLRQWIGNFEYILDALGKNFDISHKNTIDRKGPPK